MKKRSKNCFRRTNSQTISKPLTKEVKASQGALKAALTSLLIGFHKPERKSKERTQKHERSSENKAEAEGMGLPEIAVDGGKHPYSHQEGNGYGHRSDYAPQVGRDDPGESGKSTREKSSCKGRLNKKDEEEPRIPRDDQGICWRLLLPQEGWPWPTLGRPCPQTILRQGLQENLRSEQTREQCLQKSCPCLVP